MSSQWLYSRDGTEHGPVSFSELVASAKTGKLLPTDLLWKEGMAEWKPAGSVPKLFPPQASAGEVPVFVVNDKKPKTTQQARGGTAKKSASLTQASSKKEEGLDPFLVGLAIFFVAPWGLYLLWRHPVLKHRPKWWLCACGWLLLLVISAIFDEEKQSDSGATATSTTRTPATSSGNDLPRASTFRKQLSPASKEIISKYRSQHGFGTAGEENLRRMLELNEESQRRLRE